MIKYKYNEKLYAEKLLQKGFLSEYHIYELKILVKYYKEKGYKSKERKELIYNFCEKYIEKFNRVKYFKKINSVLNYGKKKNSKLIIVDKIPVTDKEIEFINKLDMNYNYKKVLFSFLVQNKLNKEVCNIIYGKPSDYNFFGGRKQQYKEIYEMSKIPNKYKINNIVNYFSNNGIVDVRTRGRINLLFVDDIPDSDNIIMDITTYDNVGYYFDWYNGDPKIIECDECEKFIKLTTHNRKYCKECSKKMQRLWEKQSKNKNNSILGK